MGDILQKGLKIYKRPVVISCCRPKSNLKNKGSVRSFKQRHSRDNQGTAKCL